MTDPEDWLGKEAAVRHTVTQDDLATALGSGDVPVLATPRMLAWLEAATVRAVAEAIPDTQTTVGISAEIDHVAASALGARVTARAVVVRATAKTLEFDVDAAHEGADGAVVVIGHGSVTRAVVDRQRFLDRLET